MSKQNMLSAVNGMLRRLNKTIVRDGYGYSDIRYSLEHTQGKQYSLNEIDIMTTSQTLRDGLYPINPNPKKTVCMNTLDNLYWILYAMCQTLDNLRYSNGVYKN